MRSLLLDRSGRLWVGTEGGLARLEDPPDFTRVAFDRAHQIGVRSLFEDVRDRLWIGTDSHGVYILVPLTGTSAFGPPGLKDEIVRAIAATRNHEIWLSTVSQGIVVVDPYTNLTRQIRRDPAIPQTLSDDSVTSIYSDRSGSMWVGTVRGVSRCEDNQQGVKTVFGESGRGGGLAGSDVYAILPHPDGTVWLGFRRGGISVVDPAGSVLRTLRPDPRRPETALPAAPVYSLLALDDGGVEIGTDKGLYRFDSRSARLRRLPRPAPQRGDESFVGIVQGHGVQWLATKESGLWEMPLRGRASPQAVHFGADELTDARVNVVLPGEAEVWVGTVNGLNRIDPSTHEVEQIKPDTADPGSLRSGIISSLLFDTRGRLWIGTASGISVLVGRSVDRRYHFLHIGQDQGLPSDAVDSLLLDGRGRVWAATNNGIAVVDTARLTARALQRGDGVAIRGYWAGVAAATREGELMFGGLGGLTVIQPDELIERRPAPRLAVTAAYVGGEPVPPGRLFAGGQPVLIRPGQNSVAVEFAVLDYSDPASTRYAHRLVGFDPGWLESDAGLRWASYSNLPPGSYLLQLRGVDRNGNLTRPGLQIKLQVQPAWSQTAWFRLGGAAAVALAVFGIFELRTWVLRRRQRELTQQVTVRTAELLASQRRFEELAYVDTLTSLPNRRRLSERLRGLLAGTPPTRFCLLIVDLDRFKQINDTFGHDAGDVLLSEAAARLKAAVRESDMVARLGGDEFALLLVDTVERDVVDFICERIVSSFVVPVELATLAIVTTPSIGIARYPRDGATEAALLKAADVALYASKAAGRNTWRWYGQERPPVSAAPH